MSVINESQQGDLLVCLEEFSGPPQGERRSPETNRTFQIGERVRYLGFFRDLNLSDNPVCWMVIVEAADGKRYAATQTYFVTEETWEGIQDYIADQLAAKVSQMRVTDQGIAKDQVDRVNETSAANP